MAPVAKSTMAPGQKSTISHTRAAALMGLAGWPTGGFVRWHCDTGPPNTVAQPEKMNEAATASVISVILGFMVCLILKCC